MNRKLIFIAGLALALPSLVAVAQEASARTVQYHSQNIVPIHAKLKYTTLIEVFVQRSMLEAVSFGQSEVSVWASFRLFDDKLGSSCGRHSLMARFHAVWYCIFCMERN